MDSITRPYKNYFIVSECCSFWTWKTAPQWDNSSCFIPFANFKGVWIRDGATIFCKLQYGFCDQAIQEPFHRKCDSFWTRKNAPQGDSSSCFIPLARVQASVCSKRRGLIRSESDTYTCKKKQLIGSSVKDSDHVHSSRSVGLVDRRSADCRPNADWCRKSANGHYRDRLSAEGRPTDRSTVGRQACYRMPIDAESRPTVMIATDYRPKVDRLIDQQSADVKYTGCQ